MASESIIFDFDDTLIDRFLACSRSH